MDSIWPNSRTNLEQVLANVPDDIAVKIAATTAQRVFGLTTPTTTLNPDTRAVSSSI
jgi:hypothetical protein